MISRNKLAPDSFPSPRLVLAFAVLLVLFNLFIAVRPKTAQAPPIKNVPEDFFLYEDWAPANYVAQGRYLESLFGSVRILSHEGQLIPGPVFFERSTNITLTVHNTLPPAITADELNSLGDSSRALFVRGSDTNCVSTDDSVSASENRRCLIQVIVQPRWEAVAESVTLVQIDAGDESILLVDYRLLNAISLNGGTRE